MKRPIEELDEVLSVNIGLYFPSLLRKSVEFSVLDPYQIELTLDDGRRVLYDDAIHSIRYLPLNSNELTEDECRTEFGLRLYRMMTMKNISQLELARLTGLTQPQISDYTYGKRTPSFYAVDKIAKALGCSVEEFRYV